MSPAHEPERARRLYLALLHHPVKLGDGRVGTASVTTLDVHDLARIGRTYDAARVFIVTDIESQRALVQEIHEHFTTGAGAASAPDRADALSILAVSSTLEDVRLAIAAESGEPPRLALTAARPLAPALSPADARAHLAQGHPLLVIFGTARGLDEASLAGALREGDGYLPPIEPGAYNHLSVRAAIAIAVDRLVGAPWPR